MVRGEQADHLFGKNFYLLLIGNVVGVRLDDPAWFACHKSRQPEYRENYTWPQSACCRRGITSTTGLSGHVTNPDINGRFELDLTFSQFDTGWPNVLNSSVVRFAGYRLDETHISLVAIDPPSQTFPILAGSEISRPIIFGQL
jgi:hypothetical protein